ncbi:hypothetical protein K466DRAFT_596932 [Polyporus arcularius HHB13444]|uniref:Uncharacterized protein n=1 Tax=Polyporus arcularius HHB13444 TaxID=1314778 RepID=A0A5C3PND7_9APHY|nr:hypothetical protein K466DRAFT_596932 [Polyporus arcularius HHB13444]
MDVSSPLLPHDAERILSDMIKHRADMDRRITEMRMFINASRPVNRLPVELLVDISRWAHDGLLMHQYTAAYASQLERHVPWYPMIAVCRRWHSLVCATPMLWRLVRILPETTMKSFKLGLSRANDLPISVSICSPSKVAFFGKVLARHRARIASLHVQGVDRYQASSIYDLVQNQMPNLRTLSMLFDPELVDLFDLLSHAVHGTLPIEEREVFMLELSLDCYPELRELSLRGVGLQGPLPWILGNPFPFPNLTLLELRDSIDPDCNIVEFVEFLGQCRCLQYLTIVRFRPMDRDFDTVVSHDLLRPLPVVALAPTLRRLVLEDIDRYIARLLSAFTVPASTDIFLTKLVTTRDPNELRLAADLVEEGFLTALPDDTTRLPLVNLLTGVHFYLSHHSACLVADAGERSMSISIKVDRDCPSKLSPNIQGDIAELAAANEAILGLTLVNVGDPKFGSHDLGDILCSIPQMKTLSAFSVRPPQREGFRSFPSDDEGLIATLETLLQRRRSQGMPLKRLRIELAGRGHNTDLSDEEQAAREARYLETLRPLVDHVECAHRTLVDHHDLEASLLDTSTS